MIRIFVCSLFICCAAWCDVSPPQGTVPPPAPAMPTSSGKPRIKRLTVRNADLQDVLRLIASQTGINMVTSPDVFGRVSLSLGEMDVEQALEVILSTQGLGFEVRGTTYVVRRARPIDQTVPIIKLEDDPDRPGSHRLTLSAQNSDLRRVLAEIARLWKRNIVPDPSVTGLITLNFDRVPVEVGLQSIAAAYGLRVEEREGFTLIARLPTASETQRRADAATRGDELPIKAEDGLLSIDLHEADPREALLQIGQKAGLNLVITPQVKDIKLTLRFDKLPVLDGLKLLCTANDLSLEKVGPAYAIDKLLVPVGTTGPMKPSSLNRSKFASVKFDLEGRRNLITLNAEDADLGDILKEISLQTGTELIAVGTVNEKMTVRFKELPMDEALRVLLAGTKYSFTRMKTRAALTPAPSPASGRGEPGSEGGAETQNEPPKRGANAAGPVPEPRTSERSGDPALLGLNPDREILLIGDTSPTAAIGRVLSSTEVFPLRYLNPDDLTRIISTSFPATSLKAMKEQNAVAFNGTPDQIEKLREEIAKLDRPGQQIMLEALVLEMSTTASRTFSLTTNASQPSLRVASPDTTITFARPGNLGRQITVSLQALINNGQARVLANPRIATVNGKEAKIDIGETRFFRSVSIPTGGTGGQPVGGALVPLFTVERVQVGVILRMTPTVGTPKPGEEPEILLEMTPEVSSISGVSPEGLPEISRRQAQSSLRVKDGESIIIGGLKQKEYSKSTSRIPILSEIPLLGRAFRNTTRQERESELMIVVTPRILKPTDVADLSKLPRPPLVIQK